MPYSEITEGEKEILSEIKNYLDITWDDEDTDKEVYRIMKNGMARLDSLEGKEIDYTQEGAPKELLYEYCRYARNKMLEYFEKNFQSRILSMVMESEVENYANRSETPDI